MRTMQNNRPNCPNCPGPGGQHRAPIGSDTRHGQTHAEWSADIRRRYVAEGFEPPSMEELAWLDRRVPTPDGEYSYCWPGTDMEREALERLTAFEAERQAAADVEGIPL